MDENSTKNHKRKHDFSDHNYDEELIMNEEEANKMEDFYSLIRNIRDARDRLMNGLNGRLSSCSEAVKEIDKEVVNNKRKIDDDHNNNSKDLIMLEPAAVSVWRNQLFQQQDFLEKSDDHVASDYHQGVNAKKQEINKDSSLDLTLSL